MTLPDHLLASFLTQKLVQETSHGINFNTFAERFGPQSFRALKPPPLLAALSSEITFLSSNNLLETNLLKNQRLQQIGDQPVSRMF